MTWSGPPSSWTAPARARSPCSSKEETSWPVTRPPTPTSSSMPGGASAPALSWSWCATSAARPWARSWRCGAPTRDPGATFRRGARRRGTPWWGSRTAKATRRSSSERSGEVMPARVVILGGGVGGTVVANRLVRRARDRARVTVVDAAGIHTYQPGFLYVPFTGDGRRTLGRPERRLLDPRVDLVVDRAAAIDLERREIRLQEGATLRYDALVIATGSRLAPEEVPGLEEGAHHFYTLDAAERLHAVLERFSGGRIVIGVAGLPYKCPPAPLEFTFLLDDYLRRRGLRDRTVIQYLPPPPGCSPSNPSLSSLTPSSGLVGSTWSPCSTWTPSILGPARSRPSRGRPSPTTSWSSSRPTGGWRWCGPAGSAIRRGGSRPTGRPWPPSASRGSTRSATPQTCR